VRWAVAGALSTILITPDNCGKRIVHVVGLIIGIVFGFNVEVCGL
jgi:hypothetical protein